MKHPLPSILLAGITGLSAFCQSGCSSMKSHASPLTAWKNKTEGGTAATQNQSDQYGRPLPGAKGPLPVPIAESKPEISDQTRNHVALAMGEMLESVGNLDAAQAQYEQAVKCDPKSLESSLALARIYARQGRPDAAIKVYQAAEKHHRRSAALFNDKGLLLADQKDWPAAIAALRTAVKLESSESKYHNNLGMILASSGNYDEAYKEFREAVGAGPAHYNVALMLMQADRPVEARNHLERALAAMPNMQKAQDLLEQLDGRNSGTTLASNEREVRVELDRAIEDDDSELQTVDGTFDPQVEHAAVLAAPATPAKEQPPATEESEHNPWSRRWVPPKWLR